MADEGLLHKVMGGSRAVTGILIALMLYNILCVFGFFAVYSSIDFKKHYATRDEAKNTWNMRLYYSFSLQAQVMSEIYPVTTFGQTITSLQILTAWLPTLLLIVPWIQAARRRRA